MGSKCCKCGTDKIASTSSVDSYPTHRARVWEELDYMEGETTEWGRPGGPPLLSRRLTDQAVKVGTRTRLLVEIASSSPLTVVWLQDGKKVEENERIKFINEGNFYCADISPVTMEDEGTWTCQGHNAGGLVTSQAKLSLVVPRQYKKPEFVEPLRAVLGSAGTVSLETKVVGIPTPSLRWYKEGEEIKPGDVLGLTPDPSDPSLGTYTCIATNCMGTAVSTSRVHVVSPAQPKQDLGLSTSGPKPIFAKELRNEKIKIGGTLNLECEVKVPPWPDRVSWYNSEGEVKESARAHLMEDGMGGYSIRVSPIQASDDGLWRFVATNRGGATSVTTSTLTVSYPKNYRKPKFLDSLKAVLTEEGLVSFECKVVGYPTPQLSWFKDGQELKPGDVYQLTGTNSLGSYCCIARNCMGEADSTAVLTVEDIQSQLTEEERLQLFSDKLPPKFIQGLKSMEAKIAEPFTFSVKVSISPEPTILWFRDDEHIDESESRYKVEKDKLGLCSLQISRLEFADQAEWKCVAMNDYGQSVTSAYLKLNIPRHYKKPKFLEELRAVLSDEGAVNLECKVIGVPQPVLKWFKDGKELKPGDIHRIISGQDGSCCLGTYTCMAQNCMGTVSSSASLLGFQDKSVTSPSKIVEKTNTCLRDTSLSTIQEERTSQMHDTDRSLTLDDRPEEVSFSFDGREVSVSLYETPDLTEEEALQIVEMYADQISEHVSEHNVVELPPMRFTKESSTSGKLLMEAMVIDVSPDYFTPAEVDDLRTDADLEEFSLVEEAMVTPDEEKPEMDFAPPPERKEEVNRRRDSDKVSTSAKKEEKQKRKKKKSTDSEKEDDSLQEFERRKTEKRPFKERRRTESEMEDDSLYEFESRKAIHQSRPSDIQIEKDIPSNEGNEESPFKSAEPTSPITEGSKPSLTEAEMYETAEDSVFDKSEISVLESLAQSLHDIQRGLATVEAKAISETQEIRSPQVSVLESLAQPLADVQRSLEVMEEKLDEGLIGFEVLETLVQPINEFKRNLKMIEEETALQRRASTIMESLAKPLQELEKEISIIQEQCYPRRYSSEERYAKTVEEVQETLTRIIERQESVPHDRKLMKTISVELQELEETATDDLEKYYDRLLACGTEIRKKLNNEQDQEIIDILRSICDLVKPLKHLTAVTSKCISVIVKDYESQGVPSAKLVESLIKPLEALKSSLDLLESVSGLKSHRAIRGAGIPLLYKLSAPMDELETTIKLVENLSAHTAVEFLVSPLENLIKIVSEVDISSGGEGFLENMPVEGAILLNNIDSSMKAIIGSISSIKSNSQKTGSERELLEKLPNIVKPTEDLQASLKRVVECIGEDLSYDDVCELAQNLSKPLQSLRSELSILQHEIEIEQYGDISGEKRSALSELIEPLEAVQNSISSFHESVLCKEDPIHLRFVLYAIKEMEEPLKTLRAKVVQTEEAVLQGKVLDPYQGLRSVTKAVRELRETSSLTKTDLPGVYSISSMLAEPLELVETGLADVLTKVHQKEKGELNVNLLQSMAEPLQELQSILIEIDEKGLVDENEGVQLKQSIQDLKRSILVIQDQSSFEYGDEPSTIEATIGTLESLIHPLQMMRTQLSEVQRTSVRTLIKTDRVLTEIRDVAKDAITAINTNKDGEGPLSSILSSLENIVNNLGVAAELQNIQIGQGQRLDEARQSMSGALAAVAASLVDACALADDLSVGLEGEKRTALILVQDMVHDLKSAVESTVEVMEDKKTGLEQNIAMADALEQLKTAMSEFSHSISGINEIDIPTPKKSLSMDELKDYVVQLERDVNLVIDKISTTVDKNVAQPILDSVLNDVKSVKKVVLSMAEERNIDESRIQFVLEKVKFIETDLQELSQGRLEEEYHQLSEACKTAQAIVSMQDQLIQTSREECEKTQSDIIETLVENVKSLESVIEKITQEPFNAIDKTEVAKISQNLFILQENIVSLTNEEEEVEDFSAKVREIIIPIKIIEETLQRAAVSESDLKEAVVAIDKISNACSKAKKDVSQKMEFEKLFSSESLSETIDIPLIKSITEKVEKLHEETISLESGNPSKLVSVLEVFEQAIVEIGKELSESVNKINEPSTNKKLNEKLEKMRSELVDIKLCDAEKIKDLREAIDNFETSLNEGSHRVLPALQDLIRPVLDLHENVTYVDERTLKLAETKYLDNCSKASNELELGLMKLEKAVVTSAEMEFEAIAKPLEVLCNHIESISHDPVFEYLDEDSNIAQLQGMAEYMSEIRNCLVQLEQAVSMADERERIESLLIAISKPVRELKHNIALIQEQALMMNVESRVTELEDLKDAIAVVCSHVEDEGSLKSLVGPVQVLKETLEAACNESLSPEEIEGPVKELKMALEIVESEVQSFAEDSVASTVAVPLLDLCHHVVQIIENRVMEGLGQEETSISDLATLASIEDVTDNLFLATPVMVETTLHDGADDKLMIKPKGLNDSTEIEKVDQRDIDANEGKGTSTKDEQENEVIGLKQEGSKHEQGSGSDVLKPTEEKAMLEEKASSKGVKTNLEIEEKIDQRGSTILGIEDLQTGEAAEKKTEKGIAMLKKEEIKEGKEPEKLAVNQGKDNDIKKDAQLEKEEKESIKKITGKTASTDSTSEKKTEDTEKAAIARRKEIEEETETELLSENEKQKLVKDKGDVKTTKMVSEVEKEKVVSGEKEEFKKSGKVSEDKTTLGEKTDENVESQTKSGKKDDKKIRIEEGQVIDQTSPKQATEKTDDKVLDKGEKKSEMSEISPKSDRKREILDKLKLLRKHAGQLETEIGGAISQISKTVFKFTAQPILESVLIDIKSIFRVTEKLLQDENLDRTRLKFINDKISFIEGDLNCVMSDILKEECLNLSAAKKTVQTIMSLKIFIDDSEEVDSSSEGTTDLTIADKSKKAREEKTDMDDKEGFEQSRVDSKSQEMDTEKLNNNQGIDDKTEDEKKKKQRFNEYEKEISEQKKSEDRFRPDEGKEKLKLIQEEKNAFKDVEEQKSAEHKQKILVMESEEKKKKKEKENKSLGVQKITEDLGARDTLNLKHVEEAVLVAEEGITKEEIQQKLENGKMKGKEVKTGKTEGLSEPQQSQDFEGRVEVKKRAAEIKEEDGKQEPELGQAKIDKETTITEMGKKHSDEKIEKEQKRRADLIEKKTEEQGGTSLQKEDQVTKEFEEIKNSDQVEKTRKYENEEMFKIKERGHKEIHDDNQSEMAKIEEYKIKKEMEEENLEPRKKEKAKDEKQKGALNEKEEKQKLEEEKQMAALQKKEEKQKLEEEKQKGDLKKKEVNQNLEKKKQKNDLQKKEEKEKIEEARQMEELKESGGKQKLEEENQKEDMKKEEVNQNFEKEKQKGDLKEKVEKEKLGEEEKQKGRLEKKAEKQKIEGEKQKRDLQKKEGIEKIEEEKQKGDLKESEEKEKLVEEEKQKLGEEEKQKLGEEEKQKGGLVKKKEKIKIEEEEQNRDVQKKEEKENEEEKQKGDLKQKEEKRKLEEENAKKSMEIEVETNGKQKEELNNKAEEEMKRVAQSLEDEGKHIIEQKKQEKKRKLEEDEKLQTDPKKIESKGKMKEEEKHKDEQKKGEVQTEEEKLKIDKKKKKDENKLKDKKEKEDEKKLKDKKEKEDENKLKEEEQKFEDDEKLRKLDKKKVDEKCKLEEEAKHKVEQNKKEQEKTFKEEEQKKKGEQKSEGEEKLQLEKKKDEEEKLKEKEELISDKIKDDDKRKREEEDKLKTEQKKNEEEGKLKDEEQKKNDEERKLKEEQKFQAKQSKEEEELNLKEEETHKVEQKKKEELTDEEKLEVKQKKNEAEDKLKSETKKADDKRKLEEEEDLKVRQEKKEDEQKLKEDEKLKAEQKKKEEQKLKEEEKLKAEQKKKQEEEKLKSEKKKAEENRKLEEAEKFKAEQKNKEQEEKLNTDKKKADEKRKLEEEEKFKAEEKKKEKEEKLKSETKKTEEERKLEEEEKLKAEEKTKYEEEKLKSDKKKAEEKPKLEEEEKLKAEEKKKEEEQKLKEEEKLKAEEKKKKEDQKLKEEEKLKAEEKKKEEEQKLKEEEILTAEEKRKEEEEKLKAKKKKVDEKSKLEEEERLKAEQKKKEEEEKHKADKKTAEEKRKLEEEEKLKAEKKKAEEKRKLEEEEKLKAEKKKAEEKRKLEEEEKLKAERKKAEEKRRPEEEEKLKAEQKKKEEEEKLKAEKKKAEENRKLEEEEKLKAEQKKKEEEEKLTVEKNKAEEKRKLEEEEKLKAEQKKKEEEEKLQGEKKKKDEEEKLKAEKKKAEEKRKLEEEEKLKAEQKKKEEEEKLKAEKKKADEKRKLEEEEKLKAEQKKKEEEEKLKAEKKKAEEKRKLEEEEKLKAEKKKKEDEEKLKEEKKKADEKRKLEEEEKLKAEQKKKEDEEKLKAEKKKADEKRKLEEEEKLKAEQKKKEEEEKLKAEKKMAEEKRKLEEEEIRKAEQKKEEEEEKLKAEKKKADEKRKLEKEEKLKAEQKTKEEEEKLKAEMKKAEEKRKLEEEEKLKAEKKKAEEKRKLEEEEKVKAEQKKKEEEEKLQSEKKKAEEKRKLEEEEKLKAEKKMEEEKRKLEEEEKLKADKKKKDEEQKLKEEEKLKAEQKKKDEEEKLKAEKKKAEEKRKLEEEEKLKAEQKKKEEEEKFKAEKKKADEKRKLEEEENLKAELKKKEEEEKLKAEKKKKDEEEKLKAEKKKAEEKRKLEEEEKLKAEQKKKEEEEKLKAEKKKADEKRKLEEEEKLKGEQKKKEEEEKLKAEKKKKDEEEKLKAEKKKKEEEEKLKSEKKKEDEKRKLEEEEKLKTEKKKADEKRKQDEEEKLKAEEKKKDEEQRLKEEEKLKAEQKKKEEEDKLKSEKKKADEKRKPEEEEKLNAEQKKKEEKQKLKEEEKLKAEQKKKEEEQKLKEEDKLKAEQKKKEEEQIMKDEEKLKAEQKKNKKEQMRKEEEKLIAEQKKKGEDGKRKSEKKQAHEKSELEEEEKLKAGQKKTEEEQKLKEEEKHKKIEMKVNIKESPKSEMEAVKKEELKDSSGIRLDETVRNKFKEDGNEKSTKDNENDMKEILVETSSGKLDEMQKGKGRSNEEIGRCRMTEMSSKVFTNHLSEDKVSIKEADQTDEEFFVQKMNKEYSATVQSYARSSLPTHKYIVDECDPNSITADSTDSYNDTKSSLDYSSMSLASQSKLKQYLTKCGLDTVDYSPRNYIIRDDYSKKDFSSMHATKPSEFSIKHYYQPDSAALDSLRKRVDKSWRSLNRFMSSEQLVPATRSSDSLTRDYTRGSAEQISRRDHSWDPIVVVSEDFSPLAQSRRYTRRRSASPMPILATTGESSILKSRSRSRSRYDYHERAPYICSALRDKRVEHGANVKLTCNIGGEPEPTVQWRKDGQPIESIIERFVMEYSFGVASLEIKSVIASDAGQYTCIAVNPAGQAATTATLRVNTEHWQGIDDYGLSQEISLPLRIPEKSPKVIGLIADSLVPSGGVIALHLQVEGCPRAEVTWLKEGSPLRHGPRTHTLVDSRLGLHTLLLEAVTPAEGGLYHCKVVSGVYRLQEPAPAHIQVVERRPGDKPALITARPETRISLTAGEDLTLTCYVSGEPKPRVMFMKGLKDITDGGRTLKESFGEYVRLTLKRALTEDSGTYFIVARNPYGVDRAFTTVKASPKNAIVTISEAPNQPGIKYKIRERTRSLTPTRKERGSSLFRESSRYSTSSHLSYSNY